MTIERQLHKENKPNNYDLYWHIFSERVFLHQLRCEEPKCICRLAKTKKKKKRQRDPEELDYALYMTDLTKRMQLHTNTHVKEGRLEVLSIYLLIEVALKPLKGYY